LATRASLFLVDGCGTIYHLTQDRTTAGLGLNDRGTSELFAYIIIFIHPHMADIEDNIFAP